MNLAGRKDPGLIRKEGTMKKAVAFPAMAAILLCAVATLFAEGAGDRLYDQGRQIYNSNCRVCHINRTEGDQPTPYYLRFRPPNFADPSFWKGDTEKKITDVLRTGKSPMPAFPNLKPEEVKALIHYFSRAFKP
jgi:mono/diheme cytochrome c family protein